MACWRLGVVKFGAASAGAVLALLLGQAVLVQNADQNLREYAADLLAHATEVAQTSVSVLDVVNASDRQRCSDEELKELRYLAFQTEAIRDVGRIDHGGIICTAFGSRLDTPIVLPPAQRIQADGSMLWKSVPDIGGFRHNVDMAARGHAIVFTSPFAFEAYEARSNYFNALVLTQDGRHVFRSFGNVSELATPVEQTPRHWYDLSTVRTTTSCSRDTNVDLCVVAGLDNVSVFRLPSLLIFGTAFLGFISGGGLGMAFYLQQDRRRSLPERVKRAIARDRMTLVYQPLVRLGDEQMVGVEALARLTDEDGEHIPPDVFIGIAEEQGFIGQVTRALIRKALAEIRPILVKRADFRCSLNLSIADILDPALCSFLDEQVAANGLDPRQIVLEITERETAGHDDLMTGMAAFQSKGHLFYIDDFGTGHSSLAYLARLPVSGIKIDRMFIQLVGKEAVGSKIVENISAIAESIGLALVVEGVETEEQAAYLRGINSDAIAQGWFYGKPVPIHELCSEMNPHP